MDRRIVQDYQAKGLHVLTNDQRMARISGVSDLTREIPEETAGLVLVGVTAARS